MTFHEDFPAYILIPTPFFIMNAFNSEITWSDLLQSQQDNLTVRFFQLPLSLRNVSLEPNHGDLQNLN